ncbi:DEKNAAC103299 [Brettanomyces naardenensis]|uniref:Pre-rRNA-processing protein n=1 Tax=Brettanomyces naardenensis TaxID=13370 RepID=A0A448YN11_BRENA|nr:DEKNAAC103299 [Brettanomyces naardenensis]
MGTSKRHRKQKQKDFAKTKLKVGKTPAQKSNFTDTSFKAKSITLNQRGGSSSSSESLKKKLSILRKPTQNLSSRQVILEELVEDLSKHYGRFSGHLDEVLKVSSLLLLDRSRKIRKLNLEIWRLLVDTGRINILTLHLETLLLFVNSGMTHLNSGIRLDSLKYLECLLSSQELAELVVKSNWTKLLKNFMILMNWTSGGSDGKSKNLVVREGSSELMQKDLAKDRIEEIRVLRRLIEVGVKGEEVKDGGDDDDRCQIHAYTKYYMISEKPNVFRGLRLFEGIRVGGDGETYVSTDDAESRIKVICEVFGEGLMEGLVEMEKEESRELVSVAGGLRGLVGQLVSERASD